MLSSSPLCPEPALPKMCQDRKGIQILSDILRVIFTWKQSLLGVR